MAQKPRGRIAVPAVAAAAAGEHGGLTGFKQPERLLSQAEMDDATAQTIQRLDAKTAAALLRQEFVDASSVSSWAAVSVLICKMTGIMDGDTAGTFRPQAVLTRAECAKVFLNLYEIGTQG